MLTFGLVVLLGFMGLAIDIGMTILRCNQLQKACDAAALAAATDMVHNPTLNTSPTYASATTKAQTIGPMNRATIGTVAFDSTNSVVTVTGTTTQIFFFAPILGFKSTTLTRIAKATYGSLASPNGVIGGVPIAMTVSDFNSYRGGAPVTLNLIRNQDTPFGNGNIIALSLQTDSNGKSPSHWQDNLASGSSDVMNMGAGLDLNSLNASLQNQQKRLYDGLSARLGSPSGSSFAIFLTDPISQVNGNSPHTIEGIVMVTLTGIDQNGNITLSIPQSPGPLSGGVYGGTNTGITNAYEVRLVP